MTCSDILQYCSLNCLRGQIWPWIWNLLPKLPSYPCACYPFSPVFRSPRPLRPPNGLGGQIWPQIWNQWPKEPMWPKFQGTFVSHFRNLSREEKSICSWPALALQVKTCLSCLTFLFSGEPRSRPLPSSSRGLWSSASTQWSWPRTWWARMSPWPTVGMSTIHSGASAQSIRDVLLSIFDMFHWLFGWYCCYCAAQSVQRVTRTSERKQNKTSQLSRWPRV